MTRANDPPLSPLLGHTVTGRLATVCVHFLICVAKMDVSAINPQISFTLGGRGKAETGEGNTARRGTGGFDCIRNSKPERQNTGLQTRLPERKTEGGLPLHLSRPWATRLTHSAT